MKIGPKKFLGFSLLLAGIAVCGVGLWLLLSPAQYQARVTMQIDPDLTDVNQTGQAMSYAPNFVQAEFEVLQLPAVLGKVINALNLNVVWGRKYAGGATLTTNESMAILKRHLQIAPVGNTKLVGISFASEDLDEAAKIANAVAKAYQDYRLEKWQQMTLKGIEVLQQEYQEEEKKIQIQQTNVDLLHEKFKIPSDASPPKLPLVNRPLEKEVPPEYSYWEEKRKLDNMIQFRKLLAAKIASESVGPLPKLRPWVEVVDAAQPPTSPAGPNRFLGAVLLEIGLFPAVGGFFMLKSSRLPSA